jgi:carboxymethylenebutenolidase
MGPTTYDPHSPDEQPVALPSAPLVHINDRVVLQPPLSRRGTGPGIVLVLPDSTQISRNEGSTKPLDPEPVLKWAEEGFAVVGVTNLEENEGSRLLEKNLELSLDALEALETVDVKGKFVVIGALYQRKPARHLLSTCNEL